jgi:hypothetical protein
MTNCYLCGANNATHKLILKDSFTAHSLAKCPQSDNLCDRCEYSINLRANYFNPNKGKFSVLYARNWSWLWIGQKLVYPVFNGEKDGLPIVENLPTREMIRGWLLDPPKPPFTIAIAESGQKHILFLAQEAKNREVFPVQFELDRIYIYRGVFTQILRSFESLLGLGATKTEIVTGNYKSQFLLANLGKYEVFESEIENKRGSRLLELISYVAIANDKISPEKPVSVAIQEKPIEIVVKHKPESVATSTQLKLF